MQAAPVNDDKPGLFGRITGWHVLIALLAFFGAVTAVNIVMIRYAVSTFGGVETPSSYRAGLDFTAEQERSARQDALGWTVDATLGDPVAVSAERSLTIEVRDQTAEPISGLAAVAVFAHPVDARRDMTVELDETDIGDYAGRVALSPGVWSLRLELSRSGEPEPVFRSRNRVTVR